jgi:hypothetical protein
MERGVGDISSNLKFCGGRRVYTAIYKCGSGVVMDKTENRDWKYGRKQSIMK